MALYISSVANTRLAFCYSYYFLCFRNYTVDTYVFPVLICSGMFHKKNLGILWTVLHTCLIAVNHVQ